MLTIAANLGAARPVYAQGGGSDLDYPFGAGSFRQIAAAAFELGIYFIVVAAAIFIAIGAYMYFASTGNAEYARQGKEYIWRSIMGLILGLIAYVLLKTISPQFTDLPGL